MRLNHGMSDVVINWAGGLHHAKKSEVWNLSFLHKLGHTAGSYSC